MGCSNQLNKVDPTGMIIADTSDDGRINYSNKAPLNMGTKHVVNMLGKLYWIKK